MRCEKHFLRKGVGYCKRCGTICCEQCIQLGPDGQTCCPACFEKTAPPPAEAEVARAEALLYDTRNAADASPSEADKVHDRLVLHYLDGRTVSGTSFNLNPANDTFSFIPCGETEKSCQNEVVFRELKCVFKVKEFRTAAPEHTIEKRFFPKGREIIVFFEDGEVLEGYSLQEYSSQSPRFFVIPQDSSSNNISILVERAATQSVRLGTVHLNRVYRPLVDSALRRLLLARHRDRCGNIELLSEVAEGLERRPERIKKDLDIFSQYGLVRLEPSGGDTSICWLEPDDPDLASIVEHGADRL